MAPQQCGPAARCCLAVVVRCCCYLPLSGSKLSQTDCGGVVNALSEATNTKVDIHRYRIDK